MSQTRNFAGLQDYDLGDINDLNFSEVEEEDHKFISMLDDLDLDLPGLVGFPFASEDYQKMMPVVAPSTMITGFQEFTYYFTTSSSAHNAMNSSSHGQKRPRDTVRSEEERRPIIDEFNRQKAINKNLSYREYANSIGMEYNTIKYWIWADKSDRLSGRQNRDGVNERKRFNRRGNNT